MMSEIDDNRDESTMLSDFSILQSKMREAFFELAIKRKLLEESRDALVRVGSEKHVLVQRMETAERKLSDLNIHLEVAIKAARDAEAERSTARELLARQGAQLEAASKDREHLQQANRTLQLELDEMKRELDDVKSRTATHAHLMSLVKKKDAHNKSAIDTLSLEITKLVKNQTDLKALCSKITQITKVVNTLLKQQKHEISQLQNEKLELQREILSLTAQKEESDRGRIINNVVPQDTNFFQEWEDCEKEMQKRLDVCEEGKQELQRSLDSAVLTTIRLQGIEKQLHGKIRELEELSEAGGNGEDKETQTVDRSEDQAEESSPPTLQLTTTQIS